MSAPVDVLAVIASVRDLTRQAPEAFPAAAAAAINGRNVEASAVYSGTAKRRITFKLDGRRVAFADLLVALNRAGGAA